MSRRLSLPYFPAPPRDYSQSYMAEVVRSFAVFLAQYQNPGDARHTRITLTDLPSNDIGLEAGTLFQENGVVKVSLSNVAKPLGSEATTAINDVLVIIS